MIAPHRFRARQLYCRASQNRIRRSLWVKQQLEAQAVPRHDWCRRIPELEEACGDNYKTIDFDACNPYVTLLNLRDHAVLNGRAVTEQIYVHSKLMIVDDRWVLVGSANINDRSLLGDRDSELAVLIADTAYGYTDLDGSGIPAPYRRFARDLRQRAWRKWMGSAAEACAEALDKPALKAGWEKIQALAKENTDIYNKVFDFIPRDNLNQLSNKRADSLPGAPEDKKGNIPASVWPVIASNGKQDNVAMRMPFSVEFWRKINNQQPVEPLNDIKGYFSCIPIRWTENENNLIPYNTRLIASNEIESNKTTEIAAGFEKESNSGDLA